MNTVLLRTLAAVAITAAAGHAGAAVVPTSASPVLRDFDAAKMAVQPARPAVVMPGPVAAPRAA